MSGAGRLRGEVFAFPFHARRAVTTDSEFAESIIEHAEAMTRLDRGESGPRAYTQALDTLVHTIRVLAVPHVGRSVDRAFYKAIKAASMAVPGVSVELQDGVVTFLVDTRTRQHGFELLNAEQLRESRG